MRAGLDHVSLNQPVPAYDAGISGNGYSVARIIWRADPAGADVYSASHMLVALEMLLRTPIGSASGRSIASELESAGVVATPSITHFACVLELRGHWTVLDSATQVLAAAVAAVAGWQSDDQAFVAARTAVAAAVERRTSTLADRAELALLGALAGDAGWLARFAEGDPASLRSMTVADATAAVRHLVGSCPLTVVASDPRTAALWSATLGARPAPRTGSPLSLVGHPAADVSAEVAGPRGAYLLWGYLNDVDDADAHVATEVAVHVLGGWIGARWQVLFREELNKTYGTQMRLRNFGHGGRRYGIAAIGMSVAGSDVADVEVHLRRELDELRRDGLTASECTEGVDRLRRGESLFATSTRIAVTRRSQPIEYGLPWTTAGERIESLVRVRPEAVNDALRRMIAGSIVATASGEERA